MKKQEKWLTLREAAEKYGYNKKHLSNLVKQGELSGQRRENWMWMVREKEMEELAGKRRRRESTWKDVPGKLEAANES